jgi:hypothetical protein
MLVRRSLKIVGKPATGKVDGHLRFDLEGPANGRYEGACGWVEFLFLQYKKICLTDVQDAGNSG